MSDKPTFGRYAEVPYDKMTPEQQEGFQVLMETRGRLPGPAKIYVHNPKLAKVLGPLGAHFRTGYSLSEREREIAVCVVCSKYRSTYPTGARQKHAKSAGLPAEKVDAILSGLPTSFDDPREQLVYEMSVCLTEGRWVANGLYERALAVLGHVGVTDTNRSARLLCDRVDDPFVLRRTVGRDGHATLAVGEPARHQWHLL